MEVSKRAVKNMQEKKGRTKKKGYQSNSYRALDNYHFALHNYQGLPGARGEKGDKGEAGQRVSFFTFSVHDINSQVRFRIEPVGSEAGKLQKL